MRENSILLEDFEIWLQSCYCYILYTLLPTQRVIYLQKGLLRVYSLTITDYQRQDANQVKKGRSPYFFWFLVVFDSLTCLVSKLDVAGSIPAASTKLRFIIIFHVGWVATQHQSEFNTPNSNISNVAKLFPRERWGQGLNFGH